LKTFLVVARADDLSCPEVESGIRSGVFYFRIIIIVIVIVIVIIIICRCGCGCGLRGDLEITHRLDLVDLE